MEKIYVGTQMATRWSDPTMVLIVALPGALIYPIFATYQTLFNGNLMYWVPAICAVLWYNFVYHAPESAPLQDNFIILKGETKEKFAGKKIPMPDFVCAYLDGEIDLKEGVDMLDLLQKNRYDLVNWKTSKTQWKWLIDQFFPSTSSSFKDKAATKKEIADHYDQGNDFFNAFMGPSMVYTSGVYRDLKSENLEKAQENKMDLICQKLMLKEGESMLDIGCGWGTLVRHAASKFGGKTTGVTLSVEGAKWCKDENKKAKLSEEQCKILTMDYRDIPSTGMKFHKVSSIEMAEHVGIANFQTYLKVIKDVMHDDGMFLMQVAGLRQGSNWEDTQWGLFMSRYIFPGADASTPLNWYIRQLELAGYEVHSVETIGRHYSHTLHGWYDNFIKNLPQTKKKYPERLCRLYIIFLAWSVIAAGQGSATCYQILSHPNKYSFPRDIWCSDNGVTSMKSSTGVGAARK
jgi:cyclopropane fatty-acyl-phospholipid synthase-like methyltransferase